MVSPDVVFERKTVKDFVSSLYDGRLFRQAHTFSQKQLRMNIIVEGSPEAVYEAASNVKAYYGALMTLVLDFKANILFTEGPRGTALLIEAAARRVARRLKTRQPTPIIKKQSAKKSGDLRELQLGLVSSLPCIGVKKADLLLRRLKTPRRVLNASKSELASLIGRSCAERIIELLDSEYAYHTPTNEHRRAEKGINQYMANSDF